MKDLLSGIDNEEKAGSSPMPDAGFFSVLEMGDESKLAIFDVIAMVIKIGAAANKGEECTLTLKDMGALQTLMLAFGGPDGIPHLQRLLEKGLRLCGNTEPLTPLTVADEVPRHILDRLKEFIDVDAHDIWAAFPCPCERCNNSEARTSYFVTSRDDEQRSGIFCESHGFIAGSFGNGEE